MKFNKSIHFLASAYLAVAVGHTTFVYADDTEIYLQSSASSGNANLLFNLDTSGSMGNRVDENNNGFIDEDERTRIEVLKDAMAVVLDSLPSINAGVMRYHYHGGPILYPVAPLDIDACVVEGNCVSPVSTAGIQAVTTLLSSDDDDAEQEGVLSVSLDGFGIGIGKSGGGTCDPTFGSVRVGRGTDDAESRSGPSTTYSDTSSDLELPRDGSNQQIVGMRFTDVSIPAGATVTDARLIFEIDRRSTGSYRRPIDLIITGESMNGTRATFDSTNQPEDRLTDNPLTAAVDWETGARPRTNASFTSSNIAAILNELVADPAWPVTGGDDVVILISKDPGARQRSDGSREVESYNGESQAAPLLTYTYNDCSGAGVEMRTGLRFDNVNVPQGSTITGARIDFVATGAPGAGDPDWEVEVEDSDDATPFDSLSLISTRSFVGHPANQEPWNASSIPQLDNSWSVDTTYPTPDLTAQVQEVVDRAGWCGGNAMGFMVQRIDRLGDDTDDVLRTAYSRELDATKAPLLIISYDADVAPRDPALATAGCSQSTIVSLINAGTNDAEEHSDGSMDVGGSDLEMAVEVTEKGPDKQIVGLRFTDIPIDSGTTIASAKLIFTADETDTGGASLTIHGQASDDADGFSTAFKNISNAATRPRTSASITWVPEAFVKVGQTHEVRGLEGIVQEIVDRASWDAGNALAFFISGTGTRVADSYDGAPGTAPRLQITFEGDPVTAAETVRQRLKDIVAGLTHTGGTPIAGTMLEAAYYFRGEAVRFGRQRGNQATHYRVSRVSHAASYLANGAAETFPENCSESNLSDPDCRNQTIAGGTPTYKSPITAECQANYLINLTDGAGFFTGDFGDTNTLGQSIDEESLINSLKAHDNAGKLVSLKNCSSDTISSDPDDPPGTVVFSSDDAHDACTVKLAQFLHDNDQIYSSSQGSQEGSVPLAESQTLDIHTIGFNLCGLGNVTSSFAISPVPTVGKTTESVCCKVANHDAGTGLCTSPVNDPAEIQVLKAQAKVGGGDYFNASTVDDLLAVFTKITANIIKKGTSFVAPSVAANAFNRLFSRDEVYFGLFAPQKQPHWNGNVKKYYLCIDSASCTLGDVLDADGVPAIVPPATTGAQPADAGLFSETARSEWSASVDGRTIIEGGAGGEITDYSLRTVYTDFSTTNGVAAAGTALSDPGYRLDSSNWDAAGTFAIRDEVCPDPTTVSTGSDCEMRMLWLLGADTQDEDPTSDTRWWFHDVLHSSPVSITYGQDASGVFIDKVLVGTNDGGMHFINGLTGEEEWVFMPRANLADQQDLYDNTASNHIYGMDSTPVVGISDVNFDGTLDPTEDFVGAVFTQRRGGSNIYALDLTPTAAALTATSQTVVPKFLWEISPATPDFTRLGETWSEPVIGGLLLEDESTQTVMVFGGGYDSNLDLDDGSGIAKNFGIENASDPDHIGNALYIIDATTGALIFSISGTGSGADIEVPEMRYAIPTNVNAFDSNGDDRLDRVYFGDVAGQVWRVDLINVNPGAVKPEGDSVVGILANISTPGSLADERRFFYRPTVVQVIDTEFSNAIGGEYDYVAIGTGNRANPLDTEVNDRFYAFRDVHIGPLVSGTGASSGLAVDYPQIIDATSGGTPITHSEIIDITDLANDGLAGQDKNLLGWYYDFDLDGLTVGSDGEKVLASSSVFAGTLIFTTYIPDAPTLVADQCSAAEGSGAAYNFDILSTKAAIDWDGDGSITDADRRAELGTGIPSEGVPIFTKEGVTVLVGTGGGAENLGKVSELPRINTYWYEENY